MTQLIYFVQAGSEGPIKIGFTGRDPRRRLVKMQTDCPTPLRLMGAIHGTLAEERQLHRRLANYITQGEWFSPDPVVVRVVNEAIANGIQWAAPASGPSTKFGTPKYEHPLCQYRAERRLTLYDIEDVTGLSPAILSQIESGKKKPGPAVLKKIVSATGIPAKELRPDLWALFAEAAQ